MADEPQTHSASPPAAPVTPAQPVRDASAPPPATNPSLKPESLTKLKMGQQVEPPAPQAVKIDKPTLPRTFQDCSITLNTKQVTPKAVAAVRSAFPGLVLELKESEELDPILGLSMKPGSPLANQHSSNWPNIPKELEIRDGIAALEYYVEQTILKATDTGIKGKILGFFSRNKS